MGTNFISQLITLAVRLDELGETEQAQEIKGLTKELSATPDIDDEQIIQSIKLHHGPPKEVVIDHMPVEMTDEDFAQLDETERHIITDEANNISMHSKITPIAGGGAHVYFVEVPYHVEPDSPESLFYATTKQFGLGGNIVRLKPQNNHLRYVVYGPILT
jgi:hypothetical protein